MVGMVQAAKLKMRYRALQSFWPQIEGFKEVVNQAWNSAVNSDDAILRLHVKMSRTAKALLAWRRNTVGNFKVQMAIIQIILTLGTPPGR